MIRRVLVFALLLLAAQAASPAYAAPLSAPCTQASQISSECDPVNSTNPLPVTDGTDSAFPSGAAQVLGNNTGTTGAVVGTLAGASGKTTYICGFAISAVGTGAVGPITIAGLATSMVYQLTAAASGANLTQTFRPCISASATNTAITTTTTADASATAVDVVSWGYQK